MPKVLASAPNAGGRHQRGRRVGPTLSEMNVIPLVDVMLVLLIIFMVAAPMLQRGVEVKLPVASRTQEIASERLFVDVPVSFRKDRRVFLGKESIRLEVLAERMRQMMVNRTDKQAFLRTDGQLTVQDQIDVLERLKEGGIENVGIVTRLPGEQ
jgi:biopolymer transport protein TolR